MIKMEGKQKFIVSLVAGLSMVHSLAGSMIKKHKYSIIGAGVAVVAVGVSYVALQQKREDKHPLFNYTDRDTAMLILEYAQQPPYLFKGTYWEKYKSSFAQTYLDPSVQKTGVMPHMIDCLRWGMNKYFSKKSAIVSCFNPCLPESMVFSSVRECMDDIREVKRLCDLDNDRKNLKNQRLCDLDNETQKKMHGLIMKLSVILGHFLTFSQGALFWYGGDYRPYETILDESDLAFLKDLYKGSFVEDLPDNYITVGNLIHYADATRDIPRMVREINAGLKERLH
ncbi:MAG: hypothetical protein WBQ73_00135 [Candidatus Babeliales bacterium]